MSDYNHHINPKSLHSTNRKKQFREQIFRAYWTAHSVDFVPLGRQTMQMCSVERGALKWHRPDCNSGSEIMWPLENYLTFPSLCVFNKITVRTNWKRDVSALIPGIASPVNVSFFFLYIHLSWPPFEKLNLDRNLLPKILTCLNTSVDRAASASHHSQQQEASWAGSCLSGGGGFVDMITSGVAITRIYSREGRKPKGYCWKNCVDILICRQLHVGWKSSWRQF